MTDERADIDERYLVPGLMKGLEVLRTFSRECYQQTVAEIARKAGISRSAAFRLVYTLEVTQFLRKVPDSKRYELASGVLDLGYNFLADQGLVEVANPILRMLRDETHTSTHLAILSEREAVYIAGFSGNTTLVSTVSIGRRFPAYATVAGRTLLTGLSAAEITRLFEQENLESFSEYTPKSVGALVSQIESDRQEKSIMSWGFYESEVAAAAAPVFGVGGGVEAALSVSCPIRMFDRKLFDKTVRPRVEAAARELSHLLGYRDASSPRTLRQASN